MPRAKQRRLHLELDPPVEVELPSNKITFIGLALLNRVVMVEYIAEPPLPPFYPFAPAFELEVTDDVGTNAYETTYENLARPELGTGRTTTTLVGRPPPEASTLSFVIRPRRGADPCGVFEVALPRDHGEHWRPGHADEQRAATRRA